MGNERQRLRHAEINPVDAPGAQFAAYFPDVIVQRAVFSRLQVKQVLPRFVADHVMQHAEGAADHDDEKDPFFQPGGNEQEQDENADEDEKEQYCEQEEQGDSDLVKTGMLFVARPDREIDVVHGGINLKSNK